MDIIGTIDNKIKNANKTIKLLYNKSCLVFHKYKSLALCKIDKLAETIWGQCPNGENILSKDSNGIDYCSGAGDMSSTSFIVECKAKTDKPRKICNNSILLSVAGTIGKLAFTEKEIAIGRATLGIKPYDKRYLLPIMISLDMYCKSLNQISVGAIQKIINKDHISDLNFKTFESNYLDIFNNIFMKIAVLSKQIQTLETTKKYVLALLLNNQIN